MTSLKTGEMRGRNLVGHSALALARLCAAQAEGYVLRYGEMRKQRVMLKNQTDTAQTAGQVNPARRIKKHAPIEHDTSADAIFQSCDGAQRHALARARRAQNSDGLAVGGKSHLQREIGQPLFDFHFQRHR